MIRDNLTHLQSIERQALFEFRQQLQTQFNDLIWLIILFGSKARGDSNYASDLDVLIVVNSDDWQLHKQISYLATDISLEYALNLSPRIWSVSHFHYMQDIKASLYQNIQRDGIILHQNETTVDKLLT